MRSYIQTHMLDSLADHVLEMPAEGHYVMRRPGTGSYLVRVIFIASRIVITGDLTIGGRNGCISDAGYGFDWFSRPKSEDYLCSKFLGTEWQWEIATEELQGWLNDGWVDEEHRESIQELLDRDSYRWNYGEPTSVELYENLAELSSGYVDDGVPGYGYNRADAGWLCAVNVKFAELIGKEVANVAG